MSLHDPAFRYHKAMTHATSEAFRDRQRARLFAARGPAPAAGARAGRDQPAARHAHALHRAGGLALERLLPWIYMLTVDLASLAAGTYLVVTEHYRWAWTVAKRCGVSGRAIHKRLGKAVKRIPSAEGVHEMNPRERQETVLENVLYEFAIAQDRPDAELLSEFIRRFPQHADALTEFAVSLALETFSDIPSEEPGQELSARDNAAISRAMSRFQNRIYKLDKPNEPSD